MSNSDLPSGWKTKTVEKIVETIPISKNKIKQSDYKETGKLPIIDQGFNLIGGYTDDIEKKVECELPVIIFGDHTKIFKFIDFEFVAGADGIKVLKPSKKIHPRLLYYFLTQLTLPDKGYSRHFQYLKISKINRPPPNIQNELVRILNKSNELRIQRIKLIFLINEFMISVYNKIFGFPGNKKTDFETQTLEELKARFAMGGTPDPKNSKFYEGNIDWIKGSDIKKEFIYESEIKISENALESSNSQIYDPGTIVVGRTGQGKTRGQTAILRKPVATNETMIAIFPIKKLLPEFLHFNLKLRYKELRSFGGDDRRGGITQGNLKKLQIEIPPVPLQEKFAKIVQKYEKLKLEFLNIQVKGLDLESFHSTLIKKAMNAQLIA